MSEGLKWRIYYRTGETTQSGHATWAQAIREGLVAVAWQRGSGPVEVELGTPYYLHCQDWIARVWDPTLYLRQYGVRFGRWARHDLFQQAWQKALEEMGGKPIALDHPSMVSSTVSDSRSAAKADPKFKWTLWYDNGQQYSGESLAPWRDTPTDGVLAACYQHVMNGVLFRIALRRYTYFYWRNGELINTDDLGDVLVDFPMFKVGCPAFEGKSYLHQAEAIADALKDDLKDVDPEQHI